MSAAISTALMVALVGMITVFVILSLVVGSGHVLISLSNRLTVAPVKVEQDQAASEPIEAEVLVAITSAVHAASGGQSKVKKIERIN